MNETMTTVHYEFHIATPRSSQIVKTTVVVCATVFALKVGGDLVAPGIRKLTNALKTEIDKWSPPAE